MAKKIKIKKRKNGTVTALMKPEVRGTFAAVGGVRRKVLSKCRMQCSPRAGQTGRSGGKLGFVYPGAGCLRSYHSLIS